MANRVKLLPTIGAEIPNLDFTVMIGTDAAQSALFTDLDVGKATKLASGAPDSRVVLCADGDEIGGQLYAVEPTQTSGGFKVGTNRFANSPMFDALIATGSAQVAIGDEVLAAAQAAPGVPNNPAPRHAVMLVKKAGTALNNGTRLRVLSIQSGTGAAGSKVTLSRVLF